MRRSLVSAAGRLPAKRHRGAGGWRVSRRAGQEERGGGGGGGGGGDRRQGFMGNQELGKEFWILFQDSCFLKKKKKGFKSPCSPQPPPPHAQIFMSKIHLQQMLGRWEGGRAKRKAVRSPHRGPAAGCGEACIGVLAVEVSARS